MKTKRPCEKAIKTTISMPPDLFREAIQVQQRERYATFSGLVQELLRRKLPANGAS